MKLIPDWKDAWKWFSVQAFALQGAIATSWLLVPEDIRAAVPVSWLMTGAVVLTVLGVVGRIVQQGEDDNATFR